MGSTRKNINRYKTLVQINQNPKNYSYNYPKTTFSDLDSVTLFNMVGDNENFLSSPKNEFLEICTEVSSRLAQSMDIPLKKVGMKKAPYYSNDGKLIDGILDNKMYFVRYSLDDYLKFRNDFQIGNYFFTIVHENRHAYQLYKFKNIDKNSPKYTTIAFMRCEKLMRDYLAAFGEFNDIAHNDYKYNSLERDANYTAISLYMDMLRNEKADISIANLEDIITEMLDYNEVKNGKSAPRKQMENFAKIYNKFKERIGEKAYNKLAEKYDLENGKMISDTLKQLEEREQNVNGYLTYGLKLFFDFTNKLLPNSYTQEKFDEHIKNGEYQKLFDEMYETLTNANITLSPNTQVRKPLEREDVFSIYF